jgi:hypothetical protein
MRREISISAFVGQLNQRSGIVLVLVLVLVLESTEKTEDEDENEDEDETGVCRTIITPQRAILRHNVSPLKSCGSLALLYKTPLISAWADARRSGSGWLIGGTCSLVVLAIPACAGQRENFL